jgi:hypothetical protein
MSEDFKLTSTSDHGLGKIHEDFPNGEVIIKPCVFHDFLIKEA